MSYTITTTASTSPVEYFGHSAHHKTAQKITTSAAGEVTGATFGLMSHGTTYNAVITLEANNAGVPSGTPLATATITGTDVPASPGGQVVGTFATPYYVAASTVYWLVFVSSAPIGAAYFQNIGSTSGTDFLATGGDDNWEAFTGTAGVVMDVNTTLTGGLLAFWKFDESAPGANATDATGNGNTAVASASGITYVPGLIGNAVQIVTGSLVVAGSSAFSPGAGSFSISAFCYIIDTDFRPTFLAQWSDSGGNNNRSFDFLTDASNIYFHWSTDGSDTNSVSTGYSVSAGNWYHFGMTYNSSNGEVKFYMGGTQTGSTKSGPGGGFFRNTAIGVAMAKRKADGTNGGNYDFDAMGLWNRALSSTEMSELYNAGAALQYPFVAVAPTVTTQAVSAITITTATGNGNVTDDGADAITERGTVISTSPNPTTSDHKDTSAGTIGAFTTSITGLTQETTYHVRAYAINSIGTSYGSDESFTTLAHHFSPFPSHYNS